VQLLRSANDAVIDMRRGLSVSIARTGRGPMVVVSLLIVSDRTRSVKIEIALDLLLKCHLLLPGTSCPFKNTILYMFKKITR